MHIDDIQSDSNENNIHFNELFIFSKNHSNIVKALIKVQSQMSVALKDSTNPHYKSKYANYKSVWDAVGPCLSENKMLYIMVPRLGPKVFEFVGMLKHETGEYIACNVNIEATRQGPQEFGSLTTYMKRYLLQCLTGVATDDDDDGNDAADLTKKEPPSSPKPKKFVPSTPSPENPPQKQLSPHQKLVEHVKIRGIPFEDMPDILFKCTGDHTKKLKDLTLDEIDVVYNYLEFIK